jgi:Polyketide cyclase / dehydrase and lipid transport
MLMLTIDVHTQIQRPTHVVFAFLADFTHMPLWNYYIHSVTQVTPGPLEVGTVFDQIRRTDRQRYVISEFTPDQQIAVHTLPPAWPLTLRFRVTPDAQGTQVSETWDLETGLPGLLERLAQPRVRAAVAANLSVLTTLLETGEARLPDGRSMRYPVPAGR